MISIGVGGDPPLHLLKSGSPGWNGLASPTEDCIWPPGRLKNMTSCAATLHRDDLPAQILLDKSQGEIETGGDARRGQCGSVHRGRIERIELSPDFERRRGELIGDPPNEW